MARKVLALLLASAITLGTSAFAAPLTNDVIATRPTEVTSALYESGYVTETGDNYIVITTDSQRDIQLNISEDTVLIDSELATPINASDIKKGDKICAEYSSIMTHSIPPQTTASLIAINSDKGGLVNRIKADSVENDADGNLLVTDNANDVIVTVSKNAQVTPYKTKNRVTLQDINKGSDLLMWYDYETLSLPARASTDKVVIVSTGEADDSESTAPSFTITVNGKTLELSDLPYYAGTTLMVPLRKIGEALGYKVGWDAETGSITIEDSYVQKATLLPDSNKVVFEGKLDIINMNREVENKEKTVIQNETTFVPLEFFDEFLNETKADGKNITVDASKAEIQE